VSRLHRLLATATTAAAAALLAGCAHPPVGPDYAAPTALSPAQATSAGPFLSGSGTATDAALPPNWWRIYQDPLLDALVAQAFAHNTDLRQAVANFEREQALEAEVHGPERPTVALSGGPGFGHVSGLTLVQKDYEPPGRFTYGASAGLSYQLDLFGQLRRAIEAAEAGSGAAQAALDLVRVNVAGGTARAYAEVCAGGLRLRSAHASVRLQEEAVQLAQRLQQAGKVGPIDTARARGQLELLRASVPPLLAQRQNALYRLATLTGAAPRDFPAPVAGCDRPPRAAGLLPVGDGAALLRRRPDVRQAERNLAAATARIGVATAELYPKVVLGVSASSAGFLNRFGNRETFSYSLGPLISWTVPDNGVARARIAQAEAATRQAAARFDGTVLTALREAESAQSSYARELDRHAALAAARAQSATVAQQARTLYINGKTAQLDALDAMRTLAASEAALAASEAQLADDQFAVFMALGGGWEGRADDVVGQAAP
jgi:NodT family efflux transporter outer membrane factor (OMF) lipoprotein